MKEFLAGKFDIAVIGAGHAGIEAALAAGLQVCTLGRRILRCETAPLAVVSAVMTLTGNLE